MRACIAFLAIAVATQAQDVTIPSGVPLRVALERRTAIRHVGELIRGRLVDPVYVYDRLAIPAGSVVEGHIAEIGGVPRGRRLAALLNGNLTPPREVRAQFDTLYLKDGMKRLLRTAPSHGTSHTKRVRKARTTEPRKVLLQEARDRVDAQRAAILAFQEPGKASRLKSRLLEMLPYHRQAWRAGTLFTAELQEPLSGVPSTPVEAQNDLSAAAASADRDVVARLVTPVSSAMAVRGAAVQAIVTQPVFSAGHTLLVPEGTRMIGEVTEAQRARFLHRNGKVLFVFRQIQLPASNPQDMQGYVEGVDADFNAHLALDAEGGAHIESPKTRFIFPAIAAAAAGLSFHQDYNAQGVPDYDIGGRAESGAVGLGLVGTVVAQIGPRAVASGIAITGAAFAIYSNFIARGANVVLPANTSIEISLKARESEAPAIR